MAAAPCGKSKLHCRDRLAALLLRFQILNAHTSGGDNLLTRNIGRKSRRAKHANIDHEDVNTGSGEAALEEQHFLALGIQGSDEYNRAARIPFHERSRIMLSQHAAGSDTLFGGGGKCVIPWAAVLLFVPAQILDLPVVTKNPYTAEADLEQGKKLYSGRCAGCHGPAGNGGKGANLAVPSLPRGQTDIALYKVIRYGLAETEMPGTNMTQREIWQIVAHVRSL